MEKKFIDVTIGKERIPQKAGLIQYDYGQILRIHGLDLPPAVEIQFSYREKGGTTENRIGTTKDGVTEVQIPDAMLKNNGTTQDYAIWVFIYVTDETSGNTVYRIKLYVDSRPAPGEIGEDQDESHILDEAVNAVNAAAERAERAEQNAKASAIEAEKYAASASESATAAKKNKEDALRKVEEKKQEAIEVIQEQEETSVGKITIHTDDEIQRILNQTAEPKRELEQTITNADASKGELDHSIETAGTSKTALDKLVGLAGTAKTELDTSTQKAGEAKTALDGSAKTAGEMQETLSATVKQAGTLDTSLGEKIETGTQLKTDLTVSGEKAVQDIQTAGSEQLGKMQAVAEEFTADREQIATNKEDIGSLKEDLSNKITKFYASNRGETHLADSDKGKIMDMMLYGKSEQFTATGKNLLKNRDGAQTTRGVTVTAKDGVFGLKGTATETGWAIFDVDSFVLDGTCILSSNISTGFKAVVANKSFKPVLEQSKSVTLENAEVSKVCFLIDKGKTYGISNILVQIEKGSVVTSYEPYTGGIPSPNPDYPQEIKSVVNPTVKVTNEDGLKVQSVTLNNITLNAISVSSGGNVTIDGQQYIADYVDVERGKLVKKLKSFAGTDMTNVYTWGVNANADNITGFFFYYLKGNNGFPKSDNAVMMSTILRHAGNIWGGNNVGCAMNVKDDYIMFGVPTYVLEDSSSDENACASFMKICENTNAIFFYSMASPIETDLTPEEIEAFKALVTNYPVTNISVTSDQLDGYTVFNYPISLANGWNYVKQQLNDSRDYIYDMDLQSAEAYVNSEYAVALTELEV